MRDEWRSASCSAGAAVRRAADECEQQGAHALMHEKDGTPPSSDDGGGGDRALRKRKTMAVAV